MKNTAYLILLIFSGCLTRRINNIAVYLENNSDVDSVITIKTFINDRFHKVVSVKRNTTVVGFEKLMLEIPVETDNVILTFVINKSGDSTSCVLNSERLKAESSVHVNFNETVFKKGFNYLGHILKRDTIIRHEFYSEVISK